MSNESIILIVLSALILYTYIGYSGIIHLLSAIITKTRKSFPESSGFYPDVTMVIAAFNEEQVIKQKIENFLQTDYPPAHLVLLIGSDCSDDGTEKIIEDYCTRYPERIRLHRNSTRSGKAVTLNRLIAQAGDGIVVFSDADSMFSPSAVKLLVHPFQNGTIGCVSGRLILLNDNQNNTGGVCETAYWNIESETKKIEGNLGMLIGANGGIYAIRKELYTDLPENRMITDDLITPMRILQQGYKSVYEYNATATEHTSPSMGSEFHRKIRIMTGNWNSIPHLLPSLVRFPYAFSYWSHKIFRWMAPFFAAGIVLVSASARSQPLIRYYLYFQITVFAGMTAGKLLEKRGRTVFPFSHLYYLYEVNSAIVIGFFKAVFNLQKPFWMK